MYTAFYGLREKPFSLSPDPRFLFLAESHREALAHLLYGIDQGEGFIAVTGEVGTGKTTLCRTLLERLGSETAVAFLFNPSHSALELLEAIATELGIPVAGRSRRELGDALNEFLVEQKRDGRRVLLIVDEAQNLSSETLEQLRLLSNLETASEKLIQILLLGQPELDAKLDSPELRQLRQRIGVRWNLTALQAVETRKYVRHRLRVAAGVEREIFSEAALREIHRRTGGIPRIVNVLCDRALLSGYAAKRSEIDPRLVRRVAEEIPDTRKSGVRTGERRSMPRLLAVSGAAVLALATGALAWITFDSSSGGSIVAAPDPTDSTPTEFHVTLDSDVGSGADEVAGIDVSSPPPVSPLMFSPPLETRPSGVEVPRVEGLLATLLDQLEAGASRSRAQNAVLEAYSELPFPVPPASNLEVFARLAERGLSVLALAGASTDTLRALDHPALLRVQTSGGRSRLVALVGLDETDATLEGVRLGGAVRVSPEELDRHWHGEAFVVWRDFEQGPDLIVPGADARSVAWLQASLAELGLLPGPPSGRFDAATLRGVRALQLGRHLDPDGAVGPRTKMVLYDLMDRYRVPRLAAGDRSG